jgi:hypothetical protein
MKGEVGDDMNSQKISNTNQQTRKFGRLPFDLIDISSFDR